jgi:hypothetical protein
VWIVNDLMREYPAARLIWTLRNAARVVREETLDTDIAADSAGLIRHLKFSQLPDSSYEILLRLKDHEGHPLGENRFAFRVGPETKPEAKP